MNATLSRSGLLGRFIGISSQDPAVSQIGTCYWDGPAPVMVQPFCPDATQRQVGAPNATASGVTVSIAGGIDGPHPAGTYGQGAYAVTTSPDVTVSSLAFWLPR